MLLAMIGDHMACLFPSRHYFPSVAYPKLFLHSSCPDCMILIAMLWEKLMIGRVHVVYITAGVALILENLAEVYFLIRAVGGF